MAKRSKNYEFYYFSDSSWDLPLGLGNFQMVQSENNLYAIGGSSNGYRSEIYKFSCAGDNLASCQWSSLGMPSLKYGRRHFVAMAIPDALAATFECDEDEESG